MITIRTFLAAAPRPMGLGALGRASWMQDANAANGQIDHARQKPESAR